MTVTGPDAAIAPSPSTFDVRRHAVPAAALALVSVATALAFSRVFSAAGFVPALVVAAVLPHAVGFAGRWREWSAPRSAIVGLAVTFLALAWISAGDFTTFGVPTPRTGQRIAHLMDVGWDIFRVGVAPVAPRPGVVLLCAITMAITATLAEYLARRPDVTIGALGPTLVVLVLTGTLGTSDLRIATTFAYVAAALVAIVTANTERLTERRTWFTGRRLASDASVIRSAALLGGAAIVASLVLTPLFPGVDSPPLLRYRNRSGTGGGGLGDYTTVSPLVDLRARLGPRSDVELFRVESPRPLYWRLVALDRFNGTTWSVASEAADAATVFRARSRRGAVRQQFSIRGLGDLWVPAAFSPVATTMGNARIIKDSDTMVAPNPVTGAEYEIRSRIEEAPTDAQIAATATRSDRMPDAVRAARSLPAGLPRTLYSQARAITAGQETPYGKAQALQRFFTDGSFTYDINVDLGDGEEAIGAFLRLRRGFCQQFAAAFAALARANGLPARVVVGFTPGTLDEQTGEYSVRGRDAHAWAEVWFAGLGWRTFEPTPTGPLPGQADARLGSRPVPSDTGAPTTTTTTNAPATPTPSNAGNSGSSGPPRDLLVSTEPAAPSSGFDLDTIRWLAIPVLGVLALAGMLLISGLGRRRRRRRRRTDPVPRVRITGAWAEALDACTVAGLPVSNALTPLEQVDALGRHGAPPAALPPLRDLAGLYVDATFSPRPPTAEASATAWTAVTAVRHTLVAGVGPRERARRVVRASFGAGQAESSR
ncbi:MAG: DUF3488 domain-containing protein [Acidimicrobiia bacterium]|nr:DUF3488 domain-containing protein [Acidimicrobiia bacterium]